MSNEDSKREAMGRKGDEALFPVPPAKAGLPSDYAVVLSEVKGRIQQTRLRTVLAANSAMTLMYWDIGQVILKRQDEQGWGAKVIDRLSADLQQAFPDMRGLSPRNLKYMRAFAAAWSDRAIVQRVIAQIPWRQNIALLERLGDQNSRCLRSPWSGRASAAGRRGHVSCRVTASGAERDLTRPRCGTTCRSRGSRAAPSERRDYCETVSIYPMLAEN